MSDSIRRAFSKKDDHDSEKQDKQKEESSPPDYNLALAIKEEDEAIRTEDAQHVESSAVSSAYERKVFILNRVMNTHIGMGKFQWQLFVLSVSITCCCCCCSSACSCTDAAALCF